MIGRKPIKTQLAEAGVPLPPTADFNNVQRALLRAMGGSNAADEIIANYTHGTPPTKKD